jgi:hypothetical protein
MKKGWEHLAQTVCASIIMAFIPDNEDWYTVRNVGRLLRIDAADRPTRFHHF